MISLFLLLFAFDNGLASEEANLRQIVNDLQLNLNQMSAKMTSLEDRVESLESEVKVRVIFVEYFGKFLGKFCGIRDILPEVRFMFDHLSTIL